MGHLGNAPSRSSIAAAVRRIASIFQSIKIPPVRSLNGLFGELFMISRSRSPTRAVAAWRIDEASRYDFASGDVRIDVKSSATRARKHTFSYDQCNPPPGTQAVVLSMLVERIPSGLSLDRLIASIEERVAGDEDLVLKLHEVVASTLGTSLSESMQVTFDPRLAATSLEFFDLREIPAVRGPLPPSVSDVRGLGRSGAGQLCGLSGGFRRGACGFRTGSRHAADGTIFARSAFRTRSPSANLGAKGVRCPMLFPPLPTS
jgi:hypothetical protein